MNEFFVVSNMRTLYIDNEFGLLYKRGNLYICDSSFNNIKLLCKIPYKGLKRFLVRFRITERLFRLEPRALSLINKKNVLMSCNGVVYNINISNGDIVPEHFFRRGMNNPIAFCSVYNLLSFDDGVIYGEYWANCSLEEVCIYQRKCNVWGKVYAFPKGSILHIHGFSFDPKNNRILIMTGDSSEQSGIWEAKDNFKDVKPIFIGKQSYRSCVAFSLDGGVLYATDTPIEQNYIIFINSGTIKLLHEMPGPCIFGKRFANSIGSVNYLFSTSVEPDSRLMRWRYMFTNRLGEGVADRYSYIVYGNIHDGFRNILRLKKDAYPMVLFQFGNILFPDNYTDNIFVCPQGISKYDGHTLCLRVGS